MFNFAKSNLFTPWTDPESGVTSYILQKKVAPLQQGFYFVNNSMTNDGRYLWFYCAFPPSGMAGQGRTLAVLDFETEEIRHFPETQFGGASPYVDVETGEIYWATGAAIYRRGPQADDSAKLVNQLPADMVKNRSISRLATHLTRSADGKEFFVDAAFGLHWVFGSLPVDGSDYQHWHSFDRNFNHAQFSPTDPNTVLFAQENHPDPITGLTFRITDRLWLIKRGEQPHPIFDTPTVVTHEWWDGDGQHAYCIKGRDGVWRVNIDTQETEKIDWPEGSWHSHNHASGRYLVGDQNEQFYRGCPSKVNFLNRETGQSIQIADNPGTPGIIGALYHIDPHPRFCANDDLIVFTTTVRGEVDVALIPTADLIARTS